MASSAWNVVSCAQSLKDELADLIVAESTDDAFVDFLSELAGLAPEYEIRMTCHLTHCAVGSALQRPSGGVISLRVISEKMFE